MTTTEGPHTKHQILLELLEEGLVMLHLDARHPQVLVPAYLKDDLHLRINLSYRFDVPDLDIDAARIQVTLSFQRTPFLCVLPMDAIWGISQPPAPGLHLFPDAIPQEILFQLVGEQLFGEEEAAALRAALDEEDDDESPETPPGSDAPPTPPPTSLRPALRLVVDNTDAPEPIDTPPEEEISTAERRALFRVVPDLPPEEEDQDNPHAENETNEESEADPEKPEGEQET